MAKLKIIKSKKEVFSIMLKYNDQTPYDLQDVTEIVVSFYSADEGAPIMCKMSDGEINILSSPIGKFLVTMNGPKTKLLKAGDDMSFQVDVIKSGDVDNPDVVQFIEGVDVIEDLFIGHP